MSISESDQALLERLKDGDDTAFESLIDAYHHTMVELAEVFVDDESIAEEVVQETWAAVIDGLDRFEGRSSLKTWIFSILSNLAKRRGKRDARTVSWSSLSDGTIDEEVAEDSNRFNADGHWSVPPVAWSSDPEEELMRSKLLEQVEAAIDELPARQKAVVTLRDVEGWSSEDVREVLEISAGNQRVLLHRGRAKVRDALERYLADGHEVES